MGLFHIFKKKNTAKKRDTGHNTDCESTNSSSPQVNMQNTAAADRSSAQTNPCLTSEERSLLRKYAAGKYMPGSIEDIRTHKILLEHLQEHTPISMVFMPISVQLSIQHGELRQEFAGKDISVFCAVIGASIAQFWPALNEQFLANLLSSLNSENLTELWMILSFYTSAVRPEYCKSVAAFIQSLERELKKRGIINALQEPSASAANIVQLGENTILIDTPAFKKWANARGHNTCYEFIGKLPLKEATPVISVYENGQLLQNYTLDTNGDEDFTDKYFHISVRLMIHGDPLTPVALIDGFVSNTPEDEKMGPAHIGYRFEVLVLDRESEAAKFRQALIAGNDLYTKALRYQGRITPSNVRLVGVCQACHSSFAFVGYSFPHMQAEAVYSDDGLDVMALNANKQIDKNTWSCEKAGKTFRYYNSFNCPHCGAPYLDYKKYPENQKYGNLGCVLLGRTSYTADE